MATTQDGKNEFYYAKNGQTAYTSTKTEDQDMISKYIIRDGNSYLILDDQKTYYTYKNNEIDLNKITDNLDEIKDMDFSKGTETIENIQCEYEEYNTITGFALKINNDEIKSQEIKTRFYFNEGKLVYIKTILDNDSELLKITLSNSTNKAVFEIPKDYKGV